MEFVAWLTALALLGVVGVQQLRLRRLRRGRDPAASTREDHLDLALWASGEELWDVDVANGRLQRRGAIPDLERLDSGGGASLEDFVQTVHPDDRAAVTETLDRVIRRDEEHADASYRVGLKGGGWVWLHSRGRVATRDAQGRVTRIVGTTRAISALKESEHRLRMALVSAGEELWEFDLRTGGVRRENQLPELALRAGTMQAMGAELAALVHPDDQAELFRHIGATLAGRTPDFRATYRVRREDGPYCWMSSQGQAIDPDELGRPRRVIGTTRNVTAMKEGEERLRLALWGSRGELWDIDMTSGRITREGELSHLAVGREGGEIRFRDLLASAHPEDVGALKAAMVSHAKGTVEGFESTFRTRDLDGHWRWVLARGRVTARDRNGWANRMLGTVHDVTAMKDVETRLRRLNEELEHRVDERTAELSQTNADLLRSMEQVRDAQGQLVEAEKMAALGSLVAGVAHEINTPLGIGVTAASHLQQLFQTIDAEQPAAPNPALAAALAAARRCVDLVLRNLGRADQLVKSFKQIAIDQSSEAPRRFDVAEYFSEVLTSLQPMLKRTRIEVEVACPPGLEITTYAGAIYQLLMNLVVNSVTHAFDPDEAGRIVIEVDAGTPGEIELRYRDDGRGMTPDVCARVFDPFFTTRRGSGGTGLGMHICYNLVTQLLRGTIRCDSTLGDGVRFWIRFPLSASGA
jgi:signal transduction histidine kinase